MSKILALVLILSLHVLTFGQAGNGVLTGVVKDPTDAQIPGASVTISNLDSGIRVETITDEVGLFRQDALVPGNYQIEVALNGFETVVRRIVVAGGQTTTVDLTLIPARFTQDV